MGYRPRPEARTARGFARPRKTRSKGKSKKRRGGGIYAEQQEAPPIDELVTRTLSSLETLGQQVFAAAPFSEYFEDWLVNLRMLISDFESSAAATADDEFREDCSRILSETESSLKDIGHRESSRAELVRQSSDLQHALSQAEREYATALKKIQDREEETTRLLRSTVQTVKKELDTIHRMRAGFLASMSRKEKQLKEEDAAKRLDAASKELEDTVRDFAAEKSRTKEQHEYRRQTILEQVKKHQVDSERLQASSETDESAGTRLEASIRLSEAIKDLLKRRGPHTPSNTP